VKHLSGGGSERVGRTSPEEVPRLHLVTDEGILSRPDFQEVAAAVAGALPPAEGFRAALHLRAPKLAGRRLWEIGLALGQGLAERGVRLIVNDRADVARALGADGVHLPERGLPGPVLRSWVGEGVLLGRSVHDPGRIPGELPALDYLLVGTLWESPSHPGRPGAGVRLIAAVGEALREDGPGRVPALVGIGGVTPERVGEVLAHGGHGVAVRGAVWDAQDPPGAAARFRERLTGGNQQEAWR
jgi:thiamine-phosphate pyrophosphorylase